jgi:glutaredoxin
MPSRTTYSSRSINDTYESTDSLSIREVIQKIKSNEWVILYSPWCGYSKSALALFKSSKITPQTIDIENINGSMNEIRTELSNQKSLQFPFEYSTRPMIFLNGKFLGGYQELKDYLS